MNKAALLDTCAVIWLANGDTLAPDAVAAIKHAGLLGGVFNLTTPPISGLRSQSPLPARTLNPAL